jgi:hypothetical protein
MGDVGRDTGIASVDLPRRATAIGYIPRRRRIDAIVEMILEVIFPIHSTLGDAGRHERQYHQEPGKMAKGQNSSSHCPHLQEWA